MKDIHLHLQSHTVTHEWFQSANHGGLKHLLPMFEIQIIVDMADGSRPAAVFLRHVHVYFHRPSQHADWHQFFTACRLAPIFHGMPIGTTTGRLAPTLQHQLFTAYSFHYHFPRI